MFVDAQTRFSEIKRLADAGAACAALPGKNAGLSLPGAAAFAESMGGQGL